MTADSSFACDRCFEDKNLRDYIRERDIRGNCYWCGSKRRYLIPISDLGPIFRDVAAIYKETTIDDGDDISYLFQEDWSVFNEVTFEGNTDLIQELCVAILKADLDPKDDVDEPDYDGYFRSEELWLEENWCSQLEAVLTGKSLPHVLEESVDEGTNTDFSLFIPEPLEIAYEDLMDVYEKEGKEFFRARIHKERFRKERFNLSELGAPIPENATPGRANRKGEPVLYLASDEETALAEVRAWKGAAVAVAKMRLCKRSKIINLLNLTIPRSPFFEENLSWRLQLSGLFHRLAEELSRPVMSHEAVTLYLPTQHLCDLIRCSGYDGIAYPSAMGSGSNVVLFDPSGAVPIESSYVRVGLPQIEYKQIPLNHEVYEEGRFDYLLVKKEGT